MTCKPGRRIGDLRFRRHSADRQRHCKHGERGAPHGSSGPAAAIARLQCDQRHDREATDQARVFEKGVEIVEALDAAHRPERMADDRGDHREAGQRCCAERSESALRKQHQASQRGKGRAFLRHRQAIQSARPPDR